ncbi:branched-chain amino acid ABC transporter ATP-binding protein/permease [Agromyces silvae]|uniref:branched-chain amino acid ABC transporter ATP-binding protein/permease n=1 Tax=Agromyces silvae TaxID=3388266 RepID=UPI00280BC0B7|nr:branched-chain amino acid ABC transporter ATP-binding protein/permease [Agromyces protaetiae]
MITDIRSRIHATPWLRFAVPAVAALVALALPMLLPGDKWVRVAALALVYVALASGLNLLVGITGLLDLGYVAFFVVGAYTTAILTVRVFIDGLGMDPSALWWLLPINLLAAVVLAGLAGAIIGYPTLRARGDYLAIMTLAFGEIVHLVSINWIDLTGGSVGIRGIPPIELFGFKLTSPMATYYLMLVVVAALLVVIAGIIASPVGRAWVAIREDELVAASVGVKTRRYKLLAYVCGASVAGVTGVFFAHMQQFINPDSFTLEENFIILSLVILGGSGTFWGPALGAGLWIFFQAFARDLEIVQQHPEFRTGMLALIVVILMIVRPGGIVSAQPRLTRAGAIARATARRAAAGALGSAGPNARDDARAAGTPAAGTPAAGTPADHSTPEGDGPVLEVVDLGKRFGGLKALEGVSFDLRRGEILGLMGPNGAGKSTLLNALSGVSPATEGGIVLAGERIERLSSDQVSTKGIARTFQTVRLFWEMTVLENLLVGAHDRLKGSVLAFALRLPSRTAAEAEAVADASDLLRFAGIDEFADTKAVRLTYGRQRRVEIARALMTRPRVLLLDEPAAGMNESETRELAELILRVRDRGVDVILIEHDMDLLMSISDRIVVLDHGVVIACGTPDEVRRDPAVVEAYLGSPA